MGLGILRIRDFSIAKKLTWINMVVSGTALLLACGTLVGYNVSVFRTRMNRDLSIQAKMCGANAASALLFNDADSAEKTLSALRAAPDVLSAVIYTPPGERLAAYVRDQGSSVPALPTVRSGGDETFVASADELAVVRPIQFQGKAIGTIYIRSDLRELDQLLKSYAGIVLAVLIMSLIAAFAISAAIQRTATRPIARLAETAQIVTREKNYSIRAAATGNRDEVEVLIQAFNEMLAQIEEQNGALEGARDELEQHVAQRTAQLETANKELEAFTYSVAHDLRAPLRHIQGFADVLVEESGGRLDAAARGYLDRIVSSTRHMGALINDLLSLAHVGRQELRLQVTGLASIVKEIQEDLKREIEGRNIEWRIGDLPFVECDPGLMKVVLYNLLSNAVKYTRPRTPAVISAGYSVVEGRSVIFVRDNGVGFNMRYADKLFGVFHRLHRREDFEGTGVGLATVQRIIQKHGGAVWAEAEIEKGATFFFSLGISQAGAGQTRPTLVLETTR